MDILAELENMAVSAAQWDDEGRPDESEIGRWQSLFGYSHSEAIEQINSQINDVTRRVISDEHWNMVREDKEAGGFSRAAYEHWMGIGSGGQFSSHTSNHCNHLPQKTPAHYADSSYLMRLEGLLSSADSIQTAADLKIPPEVVSGSSENEDATFCKINGNTKAALENWLQQGGSTLRPTFIRLSKARKNLDPNSISPTLGLDATLPQHRLCTLPGTQPSLPATEPSSTSELSAMPSQSQYPVWYFFYGTLADPDILGRVLTLPPTEHGPTLIPAKVCGGKIKIWASKYKALINGSTHDYVNGSAYQVCSKEQEDPLMFYETDKYEVARCEIFMTEGRTVRGLTFRFVGDM